MKAKVGVYIEVAEFDADNPREVERAKRLMYELQTVAGPRALPPPRLHQAQVAVAGNRQRGAHLRVETFKALDRVAWNPGLAAKKLGISFSCFWQRMVRYEQDGYVKRESTGRRKGGHTRWVPVAQ